MENFFRKKDSNAESIQPLLFTAFLLLLVASAACSAPAPASTPIANGPGASLSPIPAPTLNSDTQSLRPTRQPAVTTTPGAPPALGTPVLRTAGNGTVKVAFLLASLQPEQSQQDKQFFMEAAQAPGISVFFAAADNDSVKQKAQVNEALAQGAQVLVIQPVDPDAAAALVTDAHQAGARVIAYDQLISSMELDLYLAPDYEKIGRLQAQGALDWLNAQDIKPPFNFLLLEGAAGDPIAAAITKGNYAVLNPLINQLEVKVVADQAAPRWSPVEAGRVTQDALARTNNKIHAILANDSALARAARQALAEVKLATPVFVAGANANLDSLRSVCAGEQALDVLRPTQALAQAAVALAAALARGQSPDEAVSTLTGVHLFKTTIGPKQILSVGEEVSAVTLEKAQLAIIQPGLYTTSQIGKCIPPLAPGAAVPPVSATGPITLWMHEEQGVYEYVVNLAAQFVDTNSAARISIVNADSASLRQQLQNGRAPELLWVDNADVAALISAGLVQPIDRLIDLDQFVDSANGATLIQATASTTSTVAGVATATPSASPGVTSTATITPTLQTEHYGVPITNGGQLLLYYNKKLLKTPPADTDALLKLAATLSKPDGSAWTLAYNQTDARWLIPWLIAFKGRVFAGDGKTPTLNTPAMIDTLAFLQDLTTKKVSPPALDANAMTSLFKSGKAALVIDGEQSLDDYAQALGSNLGVARLPRVSKTGRFPVTFSEAKFLMFSQSVQGDRLAIAQAFVQFVTSRPIQVDVTRRFHRLPASSAALSDPLIADDPILKPSADQMVSSAPLPTNREMSCIFSSITTNLPAMLTGGLTPAATAKAMQADAEGCIAKL